MVAPVSGLAAPDPSLRIRNVKVRRYRGFCTDTDILRAAIRHVQSLREDIFAIVREAPGLMDWEKENRLREVVRRGHYRTYRFLFALLEKTMLVQEVCRKVGRLIRGS